jgi:alkanesulfonate monooxygenase SsuD/methylene tetrahydromethanopterin reductase-like flavin-dependent oxidoreductase (luciferase family)
MIGGSGEKKTFGLAARYFDHLNIIASFAELPGKVAALARRCEEVGRDPATLETSMLLTAVPDATMTDDMLPSEMRGRMVVGSPERIAEAVQTNVVDVGIDGVILNLPAYVPGSITKVGEALRPVLGM